MREVLEIVSKFVSIFGFITISIAIINFLRDLKHRRIEKKQNRFSRIFKKLKVSKNQNSRDCYYFYKSNAYSIKTGASLAKSSGLIIKKEWDVYPNKEPLKLLDEIKINCVNPPQIKPITPKSFPDKKTYTDELMEYNLAPSSFFNGRTYCASSFNKDNLTLDVYEAGYFDFYNTCKVKEYLYASGEIKNVFSENIFDLNNRACGIGVNTLTLIKFGNEDYRFKDLPLMFFLMHKKNDRVAEGSGGTHVVPAGSFQPFTSLKELGKTEAEQPKLSDTVYREFCEEIFNTSHMKELSSKKYLEDRKEYQDLLKYSKVYFLGMGLEPFNTKMEVLSLIYIDLSKDEKALNDFKNKYNIKEFHTEELQKVFSKATQDEGCIIPEHFYKGVLEQYFGDMYISPSAKEIIRILYERYDEIIKL